MAHIEVKFGMPTDGGPHCVTYDRFFLVPDEGEPVEFSDMVRAHRIDSPVGEPRILHIELFMNGDISTFGIPKREPSGLTKHESREVTTMGATSAKYVTGLATDADGDASTAPCSW